MYRPAALVLVSGALLLALASGVAPSASGTVPGIDNITTFLEKCPTNDPIYAQIRQDFELRREGILAGTISCTEPVSAMPIAQYTDELIAVQTLRAIYYIEGGRSVDYPWTSGSLYDWLKSETGGIDLRLNGSYCCTNYNDQWYPVLATQSTWDRDTDRYWQGIAGQITLLAHETRHIRGYPHVGYCPLFPTQPYGCDEAYDESDLSPYGIEWWLNSKWLTGELYVGFSCALPYVVSKIANYHLDEANQDYRLRFVNSPPPLLSMPEEPGGACLLATGTPTPSPSATASASPSPTPSPTASPTPSPTASPTPSPTPRPTPSPTASPTPSPTASPTPSPTASPTPSPTPGPTPSATPASPGDANCDDVTDSQDVLLLLMVAAGLDYGTDGECPPPGTADGERIAGDVDCDGVFDVKDVLALLRIVAGLAAPC